MSTLCLPGETTLCHRNCGTARACHEPATWILTAGCVHEHVRVGGMCEEHKALMEADPIPWTCLPCWDGGLGHDCVSTLIFRPVES